MRDKFIAWSNFQKEIYNIDLEVVLCDQTENSAAYIHVEGEQKMGRITLWEDGSFSIEKISENDNEAINIEVGEISNAGEFDSIFGPFLQNFL